MFQIDYDIVPNVNRSQHCNSVMNIRKQFKCKPFISEVFPFYPLDIILIPKADDDINKMQIVLSTDMCPQAIKVMVSDDLDGKYELVGELKIDKIDEVKQIVRTIKFQEEFNKQFVKLRFMKAIQHQNNLCKQIKVLALKFYNQRFQKTEYLYNINTCRLYPKQIRFILESLQYRLKHKIKQKDYAECQVLSDLLKKTIKQYKQTNTAGLDKSKSFVDQNIILSEIHRTFAIKNILLEFPGDAPKKARQPMKRESIKKSQNNEIIARFSCYVQRITPYILDLLGSPEEKHNQKAILDLWNSVKHLYQMPLIDQQMIFQLVIHFMSSKNNDTVNVILQVFRAFLTKQYTKNVTSSLCSKVLLLVCENYNNKKDNIGSTVWESTIVDMFSIMKHEEYFDIVLNTRYITVNRKIEIILSLLRNHKVQDYNMILNFLRNLFADPKSTAKEVSACKKSLEGILEILQQQLPTNILVQLRKQMSLKLEASYRRGSIPLSNQRFSCQYCLASDPSFGESDALNIHHFRDCIYLIKCKSCQQIVQIPRLIQHQLYQCENKDLYSRCSGCKISVRKKQLQVHKKNCPKVQGVYCPLCVSNMESQQRLGDHLRQKKCTRNPRN